MKAPPVTQSDQQKDYCEGGRHCREKYGHVIILIGLRVGVAEVSTVGGWLREESEMVS